MARVGRTAARLHTREFGAAIVSASACASGSKELYVSILGDPRGRRRLRPGRRGRSPTSAHGWCSARRACRASSRATACYARRAARRADAAPARLFDGDATAPEHARASTVSRRRPSMTTPGSSSPRDRPACRRASRSRTAPPRRSSTPRRGCSCRTRRSAPGDRVLAGLSVAFDASCEEMWLAWRHGACLVPAPRVARPIGRGPRPWLVRQAITVVSTVPTLAAMWPRTAIENVRLLIFGGEACPPELATRLAAEGREVWNTYGPTEATVVACAAPAGRAEPGADRASARRVGARGRRRRREPVAEGEVGELIIGGVGLARYLDPAKDAEKYAPMPTLGWDRAYRSGDLVRFERGGLVFQGRADDQVKVGGRRIELGEVETALQDLAGRDRGGRRRAQRTEAGVPVLVGYLVVPAAEFDRAAARAELAETLPAADRPAARGRRRPAGPHVRQGRPACAAVAAARRRVPRSAFAGTEAWLAEQWQAVLGMPCPTDEDADFFDLGGGSLAAAQLVSRIRARVPEFTVADIYDVPRLRCDGQGARAGCVRADDAAEHFRRPEPTPRITQWVQTLGRRSAVHPLRDPVAALSADGGLDPELVPRLRLPARTRRWWLLSSGSLVFATPFGRMASGRGVRSAAARRASARRLPARRRRAPAAVARRAGRRTRSTPSGWPARPGSAYYARALGAKIGRDVDLHALPPITGMLEIGDGAAIEPEVDLSRLLDRRRPGADRRASASGPTRRSAPAARSRPARASVSDAEIAPGSAVFGRVRAGQAWAGSPAVRVGGAASSDWPAERPPRAEALAVGVRRVLGACSACCRSSLSRPAASCWRWASAARTRSSAPLSALRSLWLVPATLVGRPRRSRPPSCCSSGCCRIGLHEGTHPVRSRVGLAGVDHRAAARLGAHDPVPALLQSVHPGLAPDAGRRGRQGRRGIHRSADPVADHDRRRRVPRRRHDGRLLRAHGRLDADRPRRASASGRSSATRGWRRAGHRVPRDGLVAVLSVGAGEGEARIVVARLPGRAPAPQS